ncbi:MAG: hypothetical protein FJY39_09415 [Betaproteobacteria bacterium]|nr:hypothetical protein [Betaproteobacteria bacterium]
MALSKIPINRLDVVLRQVVALRNADSSAIQICRLIAEQAQGRGKALAGLFVTLTCNRCAERSMGVVPVSAVLLETLTSRPFVGQSQVPVHQLAALSDMLTNSRFAAHSREVGRVTVGLLETRTCRPTAEPSQGKPEL